MSPVENLLAPYLTRDKLAKQLDVTVRTLERWRSEGKGPPVTLKGHVPIYRIERAGLAPVLRKADAARTSPRLRQQNDRQRGRSFRISMSSPKILQVNGEGQQQKGSSSAQHNYTASPFYSAAIQEASAPKSWRDALAIHPAADLFPLMGPERMREMADDIRRNGSLDGLISMTIQRLDPVCSMAATGLMHSN